MVHLSSFKKKKKNKSGSFKSKQSFGAKYWVSLATTFSSISATKYMYQK